jgi:hypothetical protein
MDFLKELFGGSALTHEQLTAKAREKGLSVVNATGGAYIPKADADNLNGQIATLTSQIADANKKLEGYDPNWKAQSDAERQKLEKMQFDFALEKAIASANPRNVKAVRALIDCDKLKFAGGEVIGLEKQLESLKKGEDTAFLFAAATPLASTGRSHQNAGEGDPDKKEAANAALRSFRNGG